MAAVERLLLTGARFPAALALTRALDGAGVAVTVADSVPGAPALHSRHAAAVRQVAAAAEDPDAFCADLAAVVAERDIQLVVPCFEEGLYAARGRDAYGLPLFAPPFPDLLRLHDKAAFQALCAEVGVPTPRTLLARDPAELMAAVREIGHFVARPALSRGGTRLATDVGPRAGEVPLAECTPTAASPWVVQEYVPGDDVCSFSIARDGELALHLDYVPSIATPGGYSLQFTSVPDTGARDVATRLAATLGLTGMFGLDLRRGPSGVVAIECNPRGTAGILLAPPEWVAESVVAEHPPARIVPPGVVRQYDAELLLSALPGMSLRRKAHALLHTRDLTLSASDPLPGLYLFLAIRHSSHVAETSHLAVADAFSADIQWNAGAGAA